ncbi:MAG TPA: bacterioferritin [Noviherbaspirillum sp.]
MQGDTAIIGVLNSLLTGELTAVDQYLIHGEIYRHLGLNRLADMSLHESDHERQHARALIQRILFLNGTPDLSKRDPLNIGRTVPDMLQADLDLEYHVADALRKAIAACESVKDYVTRDILLVQLEDTEMDHAYWLEQHMELIRLVGLQNYQQSQMDASSPT